MSKVTKRKHVMKEMQIDDFDPPAANQQIVRIIGSRGNNLHEVESSVPITTNAAADGGENDESSETDKFLVSMPTKFRKNVWVKRGDFVIVEPIEEGDKVKAEIVRILTPQHIKEFTKDGIWPAKFTKTEPDRTTDDADSSESENGYMRNTNRRQQQYESDSDESDDDSDVTDPDNGDE